MKLEQVLQPVEWRRLAGPAAPDITGVALDSRQVRSGYLFIALKGCVTDGRRFIKDAIDRGAAAIAVAEHVAGVPESIATVAFNPSPDALAAIAHAFYGQPACKLIGITGTNGKTTTAYLTRHFLERAGMPTGIIGTIVYEFGGRSMPADRTTPDVFHLYRLLHQMVDAGARAVVMEISSHALDQMRIGKLLFDVALFTNLTQDHLDYHHTMDEYFHAKRKLFDLMRTNADATQSPAVVSIDDAYGQSLAAELDRAGMDVTTYATLPGMHAVLSADNIRVGSDGSTFDLAMRDRRWPQIRLNLLGRHNVANYLAAFGAAHQLGADLGMMVSEAASLPATPGRLEFIGNNLGITIVVDYAHTDDALSNVLQCLRELTRRSLWVVFGCGGDRDRTKRPRMGAVAERLADHVILTSDNPRTENPDDIIRAIRAGMGKEPYALCVDRRDAVATACTNAVAGDVVLIAGKGHETYQDINRVYYSYDDRTVAREIVAELEKKRVHA